MVKVADALSPLLMLLIKKKKKLLLNSPMTLYLNFGSWKNKNRLIAIVTYIKHLGILRFTEETSTMTPLNDVSLFILYFTLANWYCLTYPVL